jgi:hypothetical protein
VKNKTINIGTVSEVAKALKELKESVVFVGGSIISLYADDPAADEIRPTQDIDITVRILNYAAWAKMQNRLSELGFHPDPQGHAICSYKFNDISVDIMSTEDGPLGPSNRWYKIGFKDLWTAKALDEEIKILSAPCFLATKFEAYHDRGNADYFKEDFEDIIYVLDNRKLIVTEIAKSEEEIKNYVIKEFKRILESTNHEEMLSVHIHPLLMEERLPLLIQKITQITKL